MPDMSVARTEFTAMLADSNAFDCDEPPQYPKEKLGKTTKALKKVSEAMGK